MVLIMQPLFISFNDLRLRGHWPLSIWCHTWTTCLGWLMRHDVPFMPSLTAWVWLNTYWSTWKCHQLFWPQACFWLAMCCLRPWPHCQRMTSLWTTNITWLWALWADCPAVLCCSDDHPLPRWLNYPMTGDEPILTTEVGSSSLTRPHERGDRVFIFFPTFLTLETVCFIYCPWRHSSRHECPA